MMYRLLIKKRKIIALALIIICTFWGVIYFGLKQQENLNKRKNVVRNEFRHQLVDKPIAEKGNLNGSISTMAKEIVELQNALESKTVKSKPDPTYLNYNVHAFYYAWYGTPEHDGKYYHWNHGFLPHWEKQVSNLYATDQRHQPPDDIGANFYPILGAYSSMDIEVINAHMEQFKLAGIGVLALSWYPPTMSDDEGKPLNDFVLTLMNVAAENNIKVCFHIEPYKERSAKSVKKDIEYIHSQYGNNPAFYKTNNLNHPGRNGLPLIYVYDSYQTNSDEWSTLLREDGAMSIRGTNTDAIVIGLLVDKKHGEDILQGGFDGFYTYFASSGFSYGSNHVHWHELAKFSQDNSLLFIPSVGPGYIDTNVRPWNNANTKDRNEGRYYEREWQSALDINPNFVSITSFNEWHEGTQIEPAVAQKHVEVNYLLGRKRRGTYSYLSYGEDPNLYLTLTRKWISKLESLS